MIITIPKKIEEETYISRGQKEYQLSQTAVSPNLGRPRNEQWFRVMVRIKDSDAPLDRACADIWDNKIDVSDDWFQGQNIIISYFISSQVEV